MMGNRSRTTDERDLNVRHDVVIFNHSERAKIKRRARRTDRRSTRQALRSGRYER